MKATEKQGIPVALWALTISAFGIGTTELVIVGLLPTIAHDLRTSISYTGLLVTLYALGVAIGGPILTALTGNMQRKSLLLYTMLLFIAGNTLAIASQSFAMLIVARILSGMAHGVFFAIGATVAGSLVPVHKRATAISIMFAGLTIATVTGVPLGTWVGQHWGWRSTFAGVTAAGVIGFIANWLLLPGHISTGEPLQVKDQLKVLANRSIVLVLAITAFVFAGIFATFTYMATLLEKVTGFAPGVISLLLLVYGVAIALGNFVGGRLANHNPIKALRVMFLLLSVVLFVLWFTIGFKAATVVTLFAMGLLAFCNVPGLQLYIVQLAEKFLPGTENVASALNIAAFNAGIAAGAGIGGWVIDSPLGIRAICWVGGVLVLIGFGLSVTAGRTTASQLINE